MWIIIAAIVIITVIANVVIVREGYAYVVEQLGKYHKTMQRGLNIKIPIIQRVVKKVSLKEQVFDYPPQSVITKDNVTMQIDTVVYFKIINPRLYAYGVENPLVAMETLTATTLRNIIGELELDETLTSREVINDRMSAALDKATDPWGIKVNRVEVKNIMPPKDIQDAMEKQMRAEREKRESILRAEGERQAMVLQAQGEQEAAVLRAEAKRVELVKEAEGHAESIRMHKEAEAAGMKQIAEAEAASVYMLKKTGISDDAVVKLKSLDALKVAADGKSTKIIIPSSIQGLAGLAVGLAETASVAPDTDKVNAETPDAT